MFYSNGNYMQDFNSFNQNPNFGYNQFMPQNNFQNMNIQMKNRNFSAMYPAVYRIIQPVVLQVLSNTNSSYYTEDALNNLVDTVYNIIEGDINLNDSSNSTLSQNQSDNSNTSNSSRSSNASNLNSTNNSNKQNSLLRDLIKIMILNELMNRNCNNSQMMMNNNMNMIPNSNFNQQMYM